MPTNKENKPRKPVRDGVFLVTFTLHLNVKNLQSPGNRIDILPGKTKNGLKI